MEHQDETYVPAEGSMFFTADCQRLDQLNLFKPTALHDTTKVEGALEYPDNAIMGSMIFDMLNMQDGAATQQDRYISSNGALHGSSQNPRATFPEDMDFTKEQGFDPVCFLKLPVLADRGFDQPQLNQKGKRKRPRSCKNSEEIESQRMTHIAVERNRRRQMNDHLRVLRALMPSSYVQRGDQASIIGGAIEFVKELEQLLQCLESQKRRRFFSESPRPHSMGNCLILQAPGTEQVSYSPPSDTKVFDSLFEPLREDVAEVKSPMADIEVKLVGRDAIIKILSQRRRGQLLNTIATLENLHLSIVHTNVTTIEHTVLYSFTVQVNTEHNSTAEEIATSVQHIFNMIQAPLGGCDDRFI